MTTTDDTDRRAAYADTLRRIADLTQAGVLPLPVSPLTFSFWFRDGENGTGRADALVAAEALAVTWEPGTAASSGYTRYLRTTAKLHPAIPVELHLYLDEGRAELPPAPVPPPALVAFTAELNDAAGAAVAS